MATYQLEVVISKQEDGLWRAETPALQGCFADADTLEEAISDIQECIRLWFTATRKLGWPIPKELEQQAELPIAFKLPVALP